MSVIENVSASCMDGACEKLPKLRFFAWDEVGKLNQELENIKDELLADPEVNPEGLDWDALSKSEGYDASTTEAVLTISCKGSKPVTGSCRARVVGSYICTTM